MLTKVGYCMAYGHPTEKCEDYKADILACGHCFEWDTFPAVKCDKCGIIFDVLESAHDYKPNGKDICSSCRKQAELNGEEI